ATEAEARRDLFGYVNGFYNPRGLHLARDDIRPSWMERGAA
ncbi:IS3 family transposase, partial [Xanthobacter autotrophicus ATCC 700551]